MSSSLKCLTFDGTTRKNKCPPPNKPGQVYCNTDSGKCYAETKDSLPWGFKKYKEKTPDAIYDKTLKLFGGRNDVIRHQRVLQAGNEQGPKMFTKSELTRKTPEDLRHIATTLGIALTIYRTKDLLITKILSEQEKKRSFAERRALLLAEGSEDVDNDDDDIPSASASASVSVDDIPSVNVSVDDVMSVVDDDAASVSVDDVVSVSVSVDDAMSVDLASNAPPQLACGCEELYEEPDVEEEETGMEKTIHKEEETGGFSLIVDAAVPDYKIIDYIPTTLSDIKNDLQTSFRMIHVI